MALFFYIGLTKVTLSIIKTLATYKFSNLFVTEILEPNTAILKDDSMTNEADNWYQLARYDTNIQGELHANLLRNNGITVSLQPLSAIPGMNTGIVLWVENDDLASAQRILDGVNNNADGASLLAQMSDAELGIVSDNQSTQISRDPNAPMNKGGTF